MRLAKRVAGLERTMIRKIFDAAPADAINLGLGQPDLPTPDPVALAGIEAIHAGRTAYTSTAGDPELRAAIAAQYPDFVSGADDVLVTVGTQEAMFVACLALLDPGDEILVPDPGYPAYPVVARLLGAGAVAYPLRPERSFIPDPAEIEERLTPRTRAVILCSPSNPTGMCTPRHELESIVSRLRARGIPWISDEIYAGFHYGSGFCSTAELGETGGLLISGLSKDASMTGWRIGWVAGARTTLQPLVAAHQYLVTCAPSISQRAALAALGPRGRGSRDAYREEFARRREVMGEELSRIPDLRFVEPDGAFYFFVDVSAYGDSVPLARRILDRCNVVVIPGEAFGANGRGWLRLSYGVGVAQIREGVRRIAAELRSNGVG